MNGLLQSRRSVHGTLLGLAILTAAGLAGCGGGGADAPETYEVTGQVTLDGRPLPEGDIIFESLDDPNIRSYAGKIADGQYSVAAEAGRKRVRISSMAIVPGEFDESNPGERTPKRREAVPAQYNTNSELEATVTADGENQFDFELTTPAKP